MSQILKKIVDHAFFEHMAVNGIPAVQAAHDKITAGGFSGRFIFEQLSRDLNEVSLIAPEWSEFISWKNAVSVGAINRPSGTATLNDDEDLVFQKIPLLPNRLLSDDHMPAHNAELESRLESALAAGWEAEAKPSRAVSAENQVDKFTPLKPADFASPDALKALTERMVNEAHDALKGDFEKQARCHAAKRLRRLADELERGAA